MSDYMSIPANCKFAKNHEYVRPSDNGGAVVYVGISAYAVDQLQREIVYVELPPVGRDVFVGDAFGLVEAVKAASDIFAPVSGKVVAVNDAAVDDPMLLVRDPWGEGWLVQIEMSNPAELDELMDADEYAAYCKDGGH